jgi:cellulose synthase operon protein C
MHHWFRLGERHAPRSPSGRGRLALLPLLLLLLPPALVSVSAGTSTSIVPAWSRIAEPEARLELARLLSLREGRLTEAREQYSLLLAQDPENPAALLGLARVLTRLEEHAPAVEVLRRLSSHRLHTPGQRLELAGLLADLGQAGPARETLQTLLTTYPENTELALQGASLMQTWGDFQRAETRIRELLAGHDLNAPTRRAARLELSNILRAKQQYEQAEGVLRHLLLADPEDEDAMLALIELRIAEKDFADALRMVRQLSGSPDDADLARLEASILFQAAHLEEALAVQEKLVRRHHGKPESRARDELALARTLLRLGREERAIDLLRSVLDQAPKTIEAQFLWMVLQPDLEAPLPWPPASGPEEAGNEGQSRLRRPVQAPPPDQSRSRGSNILSDGRQSAAMYPRFVSWLKEAGLSPRQLEAWGRLYARAGAYGQAVHCLEAALEVDAQYYPARLALAEVSASRRDYDRALNLLHELLLELPQASKLELTRARVLSWAEQYRHSLDAYEALHAFQPNDPVPLREAARVAMWSKQPDKAAALYQNLDHIAEPGETLVDVRALQPLVKDARLSAALRELENALKQNQVYPSYEHVHAALTHARSLPAITRNRLDDLMLDLLPAYRIQKSAHLEKQAKMQAWKRHFLSAMHANQRLLEVEPGNQEAWFDLAQAQCMLGLHDQEQASCRHLLNLDPLHDRARKANQRIALRARPGLQARYGFWNEKGQGGSRLSAMQRHFSELGVDVPLATARAHIFATQHFWTEQPQPLDDLSTTAQADISDSFTAQGQTFGLRGVLLPWLRGDVSLTRKDYANSRLGTRTMGRAGLELNLRDYARLGLEYERGEELANGLALTQKIMSDVWRVRLASDLTRSLDLKVLSEFKHMDDDNKGVTLGGDLSLVLTDHPRELKITLASEYRDFQHESRYQYAGPILTDVTHPYWTPQDYLAGAATLQWRHDLSELFFCGARQHLYLLKLTAGTDSDDNPGLRLEGEYRFDFTPRWTLTFQGLLHRSRQWDAEGLWLGLEYTL